MAYRIEAFDTGLHDTKDFRCGSDSLDNFLRRTAKRQQRDGYTRVYVATDAAQTAEPRACLGFYAINAHAIGVAEVPGDAAPRPPRSKLIPGVFLSHLAVNRRQQGNGLGRILLVDAMQQCQRAGQILGVRLMLLDVAGAAGDAERARLQSFYASMGVPALARTSGAVVPLSECPSTPAIGRIRHQRRRCFLLQPVMVASTFSRCHCRGPRPWVQPQRR